MNALLLPTLFISYSHADRSLVEEIAKDLRITYNNYSCTWYDEDLIGGTHWWANILLEISQRALFIFVMSNESIDSEYCQKELDEAFRLNKIIIPVLGRIGTKKPDRLSEIQHVDMSTGRVTKENIIILQKTINSYSNIWATPNFVFDTKQKDVFESNIVKGHVEQSQFALIEAGPGTGKTTSLIEKVKNLLKDNVDPSRIMLVTFTRRASADIERKLEHEKVRNFDKIWRGTLHSFCFNVVISSGYLLQRGRIARPLLNFERDFLLWDLKGNASFGDIHERRRRLKAFEASWSRYQYQSPDALPTDIDREFERAMLDWLSFHQAILMEELVKEILQYLKNNRFAPELTKFDYVLVDEYQDLNRADQAVIDLIAENCNLTVVGDRYQSIYGSLRYAHPEGIVEFPQTHKDTSVSYLTKSYRCPKTIVDAARNLIAASGLQATENSINGRIHVVNWHNLEDEAKGISEFINVRINRDHISAGEILVLCPTRQTGYLIRDLLIAYGIEAHSFFNEEILDSNFAQTAFTLLRLLVEPDDRVALRCWLGLDHTDRRYSEYLRINNYLHQTIYKSPREILDQLCDGTITIKNTKGIVSRYMQLQTHVAQLTDKSDREKFNTLFPLEEEWAKPFHEIISKLPEEDSKLRDIYELIQEHIVQPEKPSNATYVRVMSLHSSKGLESDLVIVTGCINGFIPRNPDSNLSQVDQSVALEEQKRLFYVSITRSKGELVLSIPQSISRELAHRFKMEFPKYGYGDVNTFTSSFITKDLGSVLPRPVRSDLWRY